MKWQRFTEKPIPRNWLILAGSWRKDWSGKWKWTTSKPFRLGATGWPDADRTHYLRLPSPPKRANGGKAITRGAKKSAA